MADIVLMESIKRCDDDIKKAKRKLKDFKETYKNDIQELPEFTELQNILEQAKGAREALKKAVGQDINLVTLADEIEQINFQVKDLNEILSHHLVEYFEKTGEKVIIEDNDDRPILLTAKLGDLEPHQEEMFDRDLKVTITKKETT